MPLIDIDREIKVVEIGVRYGESTQLLLNSRPNIIKYYAIDPYESYDGYGVDDFNRILLNENGDRLYDMIKKRFERYQKLELIRKFSSDAHRLIKNLDIDFCFVDGNHAYDYVYSDLENYFPKVKEGGIIAGDDYFMRHKDNDILHSGAYDEKMVYEAVQDFFRGSPYTVEELGEHRGYAKTFFVRKIK